MPINKSFNEFDHYIFNKSGDCLGSLGGGVGYFAISKE
jgi:hypothetical protein